MIRTELKELLEWEKKLQWYLIRFSGNKTGTFLSLNFFKLKLDCQMDREIQETVSAVHHATSAGLRPLMARDTDKLDQTKLDVLMKGPSRDAIMASELTAQDVMKAIAVCVGIHKLTQSKLVENDEVQKIHQ